MKLLKGNNIISFKFKSVAVLSLTIILALFGYIDYQDLKNDFYIELQRDSELLMARLQLSLPLAMWNYQTEQVNNILDAELGSDFVSQIQIFDGDKKDNLLFAKKKNRAGKIVSFSGKEEAASIDNTGGIQLPVSFSDEYTEQTQVGLAVINIDDSSTIGKLEKAVTEIVIKMLVLEIVLIALSVLLWRFVVTKRS